MDAPIHGQGCLTRDHNGRMTYFAGGLDGDKAAQDKWLRQGQAAKELVKGGHYAGSLNDWEAKQRKHAWKSSLRRADAEGKKYKSHGGLCENGCGRPAFGRFPTCCTHCKGKDGPHAADCFAKNSVPMDVCFTLPQTKAGDKRGQHKSTKPTLTRKLSKGMANVSKRFSLKNVFGKGGGTKVAPG